MKSSNMSDRDFDRKLKRTFDYVTEDIKASDDMLNCVKSKLNGGKIMKFKIKKSYVLAAAVVLSLTAATGIIASSGVASWSGGSSHLTRKTDFPDKETIKKEFDYNFKYVKEFDNGFKFDFYNFSNDKGMDEAGNVIIESKNAHFDYIKNKGMDSEHRIYFSADKMSRDMYSDDRYDKAVNYKNVDIHYSDYTYKAFPPDIEEKEASAEDKAKAEALMAEVRKEYPGADDITKVYPYLSDEEIEIYKKGKLTCAYGSQEIETQINQSVVWYENGAAYCLLSMDSEWIEPDEFIDMAKQVIDSEDIANVEGGGENAEGNSVSVIENENGDVKIELAEK